MPTFDVTSPDGRKFRINAPEGATRDQALAFAQKNMPAASPKLEGTSDPMTGEIKGALGDIGSAVSPENIEKGRILGVLPKAPIDLAKGLLRLGSAPATVAMHGAGQAGSAATGGFLKPEEVESALSVAMPGRIRSIPGQRPPAPTTEAIHDASNQAYANARGLGVEFHQQHVDRLADHTLSALENDGFRERNIPHTWAAINELREPAGRFTNISDIESVRKVLNVTRRGDNEAEREAAGRAIEGIDNFLANLTPAQVSNNPHLAPRVSQQFQEARANWGAYRRSQQMDELIDRAERRTAKTGKGGNYDNVLRQEVDKILNSPRLRQGFNQDEIAAMQTLVRGTPGGNVLRRLGAFAPTGVVSGSLGSGIGALFGGPAGAAAVPLVSGGLKHLADRTTRRQFEILNDMVRRRAPMANTQQPQAHPSNIDQFLRRYYPAVGGGAGLASQDQNQ